MTREQEIELRAKLEALEELLLRTNVVDTNSFHHEVAIRSERIAAEVAQN